MSPFSRTLRQLKTTIRHLNERSLVFVYPDSGKTTLPGYYALKCLDGKHSELGFNEEIFPVFYSLRDLEFTNEEGKSGESTGLAPFPMVGIKKRTLR